MGLCAGPGDAFSGPLAFLCSLALRRTKHTLDTIRKYVYKVSVYV